MSRQTLSLLAVLTAVAAQTPLIDQIFPYNAIPYQVDTNPTGRGPQSGYNRCNSTTEGPNSMCQTLIVNNITDFCLWGPPTLDTIANQEAATVAYCTKATHGARQIPAGALTGVHFINAPGYIQILGTMDQTKLDIQAGDSGGELDPHGDDQRGNPLGGLVYSNSIVQGNTDPTAYTQVVEWNNFLGSNVFCLKLCRSNTAGITSFCDNVYDRTGCDFVSPGNYTEGVFEVCDSDNQDPPGVYTTNGQVTTFYQPAEGVPINTLPTVKTPSSSNCRQYSSAELFGTLPAASSTSSSASSLSTSTKSSTASGSSKSSGGGSSAKSTGASSSGASSSTPTSSGAAFRRADVLGGNGNGAVVGVALSLVALLGGSIALL